MLLVELKTISSVVKELRSALPKIQDTNSPQCCCLIKVTDTTHTVLTVRVPGQLILSITLVHDGFDTGGTLATCLVNLFELEERIKQIDKTQMKYITLETGQDGLQLGGRKAPGDANQHRTSCRVYAGSITDFPSEPEYESKPTGIMSGSNFATFCNAISTFGDHKPKKQGDGNLTSSPIEMSFTDGAACGRTINSSSLHQAYAEVVCPAVECDEASFVISGHVLKFLVGMAADEVSITRQVSDEPEGTWVQFQSESKRVAITTKSSSIYRITTSGLLKKDNLPERVGVIARRVINSADFSDACTVQASTSTLRRMLITEEAPNLVMRDSQQIATRNHSLVKIEPEHVVGDWPAVLCSYDFAPLVYQTVKVLASSRFSDDYIVLELRTFQKSAERVMHLFYAALKSEESNLRLRIINPVELAEVNIDLLDSGD